MELRPVFVAALAMGAVTCALFPSLDGLTGGDASTPVDASSDVSSDVADAAAPLTFDCDAAGLVAYWPLDDGQGTIARDCLGRTPGTIVGATWSNDAPDGGVSLEFSGTSYVDFPSNPAALTIRAPFTIAMWMKADASTNPTQDLAVRFSPGAWGFGIENGNSLYFTTFIADGGTFITGTPPNYPAGVWRHVAGVLDGNFVATIYVDGQQVASSPASNVADVTTALRLGVNDVNGTQYSGHMARVAFFSRALSATEVATLAATP